MITTFSSADLISFFLSFFNLRLLVWFSRVYENRGLQISPLKSDRIGGTKCSVTCLV